MHDCNLVSSVGGLLGSQRAYMFLRLCCWCRCLKVSNNAELKQKFDNHKSHFVVGSQITIPAFMSVSLDGTVADDFGDHVLFNFTRVRGVNIHELSAHPKEAQVCVPPPSLYRIIAVAKIRGSVIVTLERIDPPLSYLAAAAPQAKAAAGGGAAAQVWSSCTRFTLTLIALFCPKTKNHPAPNQTQCMLYQTNNLTQISPNCFSLFVLFLPSLNSMFTMSPLLPGPCPCLSGSDWN